MLISAGLRLFRFLLSLVIRLRRSFGRRELALPARLSSLWKSILTFVCPRGPGQSQIQLHANNVPVVDISQLAGGPPQTSEPAKVEEENRGTLAALPVWGIAHWRDELSRYQALTLSSNKSKVPPSPATPERGSQRYERRPEAIRRNVNPPTIPVGQQKLLSALQQLPDGWKRHVHPEGNVLFYHEGLRIFTESDIINCETEILFHATTLIQQATQKGDVILDDLTEIVLNVDSSQYWHYYFVDHTHRLLFWVDEVDPQDLGTDLQGVTEYSHIRYFIEAQYWYAFPGVFSGMHITYDVESRSHCEYYPHNRTLSKGVFDELRGMLNYAKTDMMTANSSTSPFAQEELAAILDLVNSLKDDKKISDPYSIWIIARLMAFFTEDQFMNFCGQPCARLNADAPLFGQQTWNRGTVFKLANWFLLFSLNEHAVRLQRIWVDGTIIQPRWKDFISRLTSELGRYTIFSTVMLAVNFSFLAVPGVVIPGTPASRTQIIIYSSVVSTIGSIVFSLALLNVYSDPRLMRANPAADVLKTLNQNTWGMARFAITHSLPNACLKWSILLFATALASQIFGPKELPTYVALAVECTILVLLGFVGMHVMWLFSWNDDAHHNVDTHAQDNPPHGPTGPKGDIEQGSRE